MASERSESPEVRPRANAEKWTMKDVSIVLDIDQTTLTGLRKAAEVKLDKAGLLLKPAGIESRKAIQTVINAFKSQHKLILSRTSATLNLSML
jgi:hypothetical protein